MHTLQTYGTDFFTGTAADGRQVLMGLLCPEVVAYFFAPDGSFLQREACPWEYPAPRMGDDGPYQIYDDEFERRLGEQIRVWQDVIGFASGAIRVLPFRDDAYYVGVQDKPEHLEDTAEVEDDDECGEIEAEWKEWALHDADDEYVFLWAKEYYIGSDGSVFST